MSSKMSLVKKSSRVLFDQFARDARDKEIAVSTATQIRAVRNDEGGAGRFRAFSTWMPHIALVGKLVYRTANIYVR